MSNPLPFSLVEKITELTEAIAILDTIQIQIAKAEEKTKLFEDAISKFDTRFAFIHPILLSVKDLSNTVQRV